MSAPNDRDLNPQPLPPNPPPDVPRKSASPLIWILLLIALLAFGWYFYNQRSVVTPPAETLPPPTTDAMTPGPETSAEREPARRAAVAKPARPAPPKVVDRDPRPVAQAQPEYPAAAFRAGEQGTVMVRADIDVNGNPTNVEVAKRSGSRDLDRAARDAVSKWRFEPAMKGGKPVAATVQVPVEFTLERQ